MPVREMITTPLKERGMPIMIFLVIFSLRKSIAKITVKIGIVAMMRLAVDAEICNSP